MRPRNLLIPNVVIAALAGCTAAPRSIIEIDVSGKDPSCVRQCTTAYSSCVTGGIVQNNQLAACHDWAAPGSVEITFS
jgi:hypothetical protein